MRKRKVLDYSYAFLFPVMILGAVYFMMDILPFGNETLLTTDMNAQYVAFFSYLKDSLLGNQSLLYSFSKTMSGEMIGLTAYYLMSPFNLVFLVFNKTNFPLAISIVTLLKTGSAGLTMYFYLRKKKLPNNANLLLAATYALCGYSIVYQQNIMWLDAVILFPLVIHGIDKILYEKKINISYAIFLFLTLVTNFYIGFMVCIFAVIYFIASILAQVIKEWGGASFSAEIRKIGEQAGDFALQSLLAGGLGAFLLLPTWFSLQGGKAEVSLSNLLNEFILNFSLLDFLSKFVIGAFNHSEKVSGFPNIFVSLFVVLLVLIFIFNRKIDFASKVKYILLLGALYLSFKVNFFNLIWHGAKEPVWFPYRYSFIFSFVLIVIASKQLKSKFCSRKALVSSSLLILFLLFMIHLNDYSYLRTEEIILTGVVVLIWTVFIWGFSYRNKKVLAFLSFALIAVELSFNSYWSLSTNNYNEERDFNYFVTENQPIIDAYKRRGDEFYRIEKTYHYAQNDPLLLGYEGLSHFNSTEKTSVKDFFENMGYASTADWARYSDGSSVAADSFMGMRYLISDYSISHYPLKNVIRDVDNKYIYENPYYFPLGFHTSHDLSGNLNESNPFTYQNDLFSEIFGVDELYKPVPSENIQRRTENLEPIEESEHRYHYEKTDESEDAFVYYELSNINSDYINFFFESDLFDGVNVYVNGEYIGEDLNTDTHTINVARPESENVTVALELKNDEIFFDNELFYTHDDEGLAEMKNMAEENKLNITQFEPTRIKGTVNNEKESTLVLTIPYDSSWRVIVDGEKANTFPVFDTLMGIELPANSENIEMSFVPKGLLPGTIISIGSLAMLGGYYWIFKRRRDLD